MPENPKVEKWLNKKKAKHQYWQVKTFLDGMRIPYAERDKNTLTHCIVVSLFGIKFRFNGMEETNDAGWKVFLIDTALLESTPDYFREDVMWYLVEKGYLLYIRNIYEHVFKHILIDSGWAVKIMKKRIELCGKEPEHTFMRVTAEEMLKLPVVKILAFNPGYFDYLL